MLISRTAYRFAKALLEFAIEQNQVEAVYNDVLLTNKVCKESRELRVMLGSPVIKVDKKEKTFNKIFADNLTKTTSKFFAIVFRRRREELILDITESFISQYKEFKHILIVTVESAFPLSDENRNQVMEFLKTRTTEGIELVEKVNEELIGGLIIRMEDLQIDASVKNSLSKLEREFSKDIYSAKL